MSRSQTISAARSFCGAPVFSISLIIGMAAAAQDGVIETDLRFVNVTATHLPAIDIQSKDAKPADIDNDGDLDLIIAHEYKANVVLVNDGAGNFTNESQARLPQVDRDSEDIAVADFDGDGDIDLLFVSEDDQENEYYVNDGAGVFAPGSFPTGGVTNGVAVADINNDGALDLILGNALQNAALVNNRNGQFVVETTMRLPAIEDATQDLEFGDADGDGDLDLLVANEGANRLLINNGAGVFADESDARIPYRNVPEETREADFGDIDGDGDLDIIFANVNFRRVGDPQDRILINDGNGFFTDETANRLPAQSDYTMDADFADVDADGDLDIITAGLVINKGLAPVPFRIFSNDGTGRFEDLTAKFLSPDIAAVGTDIEAADFNGDGRIDLFFANRAGGDLLVFSPNTP